jgi:hypothetical protein
MALYLRPAPGEEQSGPYTLEEAVERFEEGLGTWPQQAIMAGPEDSPLDLVVCPHCGTHPMMRVAAEAIEMVKKAELN